MVHPSAMFVVDRDVTIMKCNDAAVNLLNLEHDQIVHHRGGTVLQCINSNNDVGGCGCSHECITCDIRNSINKTFTPGEDSFQIPTELIVYLNNKLTRVNALITAIVLDDILSLLMIENITELNKLKELIPICSGCKNIRDDSNYWKSVEDYIMETSNVDMTHGLCPSCIKKYHPELADEILKENKY